MEVAARVAYETCRIVLVGGRISMVIENASRRKCAGILPAKVRVDAALWTAKHDVRFGEYRGRSGPMRWIDDELRLRCWDAVKRWKPTRKFGPEMMTKDPSPGSNEAAADGMTPPLNRQRKPRATTPPPRKCSNAIWLLVV